MANPDSPVLEHFAVTDDYNSIIDYRLVLQQYIQRSPDFWDDSYDRRFIHSGLYLDSLSNDSLHLRILIDSSGSIDIATLSKFLSEVRLNLLMSRWASIHFQSWFFDTALYPGPNSIDELMQVHQIPGGGGTSFSCFVNPTGSVISTDIPNQSSVTLIYTDGYSYEMPQPHEFLPLMPIVWCTPSVHECAPQLRSLATELGSDIIHCT